jgi:adenylyltransferase/sulfurtransferase
MNAESDFPSALARYSRQMLFAPLGVEGQRRLRQASVTLVGCGALGSSLADMLVRGGIGYLRIIDRDFIELDNLQRQTLFDEHDLAQNLPKAEAAARKLRKINSAIEVEGIVADVNPGNAVSLCADADLLLDGTDNLETRYLINDVAVKHEVPWVFGACLAAEGLVLAIVPHVTPCLRCIWPEPPPAGSLPTCDSAGILAATAHVVAGLQATAGLQILVGLRDQPSSERTTGSGTPGYRGRLLAVDVWSGRFRIVNVQSALEEGNCPCCQKNRYDFLSAEMGAVVTTLCGRNAVQIRPTVGVAISLKALAARLPREAQVTYNEFVLRFRAEAHTVTVFPDGRAIVQGTSDARAASDLYAKYVTTEA